MRKQIRDWQYLVREAWFWSNYTFAGQIIIIIIVITPSSRKLKMPLTGTLKLGVHLMCGEVVVAESSSIAAASVSDTIPRLLGRPATIEDIIAEGDRVVV